MSEIDQESSPNIKCGRKKKKTSSQGNSIQKHGEDKGRLSKEKFISGLGLRLQSFVAKKAWWQENGTDGNSVYTLREQREIMSYATHFLLIIPSETSTRGMVPPMWCGRLSFLCVAFMG